MREWRSDVRSEVNIVKQDRRGTEPSPPPTTGELSALSSSTISVNITVVSVVVEHAGLIIDFIRRKLLKSWNLKWSSLELFPKKRSSTFIVQVDLVGNISRFFSPHLTPEFLL